MPYKGPTVICRFCGQPFTRPSSLVRHLDESRCPGQLAKTGQSYQVAIVPTKPRLVQAPIRAKIIDVTPVRSEIVRSSREAALGRSILAKSEPEPDWFAREFSQDAKAEPWFKRDGENRGYYERAHAAMERSNVSLPRRPNETDSVTLWEQYHFLKAIAVRLDAGRGTERDRKMFEAGLPEYNANYDRILAQSSPEDVDEVELGKLPAAQG
jgi:hypothetical protein